MKRLRFTGVSTPHHKQSKPCLCSQIIEHVRSLALFLLLISTAVLTHGQNHVLDSTATVSVLTCGPGSEFYTSFGHTAIRICDTANDIDEVYNYGTFDFDTPHFYLTFARGRLNYCLSRTSFVTFLQEYIADGRSVWEQQLNLTQQEKQNLYVLLQTNYQPEYRYYLYDFFRDNCATRIRDIVNSALCHRTLTYSDETPTDSYRQLLSQCTKDHLRWWQLGVDIVLGSRCDHQCTPSERMFLPNELMHQFDKLTLQPGCDPLVTAKYQVLTENHLKPGHSISPTVTFWVLFVVMLGVTIIAWQKKWSLRWMDVVLFSAAGVASLVIIFLWFLANHYCTKYNWNILWASPIYLYLAIFPRKKNLIAAITQLVALATLAVIAVCGIQDFNEAILPVALTLFIRTVNLPKTTNNKIKSL